MRIPSILGLSLMTLLFVAVSGCETAPSAGKQSDTVSRARSTQSWFERKVPGLGYQISNSAGYIVFPDVGQAGFIVGGTSGRGVVMRPNGTQLGWASINTASFGLQAGVQGFRMLMVIEDPGTLNRFMQGKLTGSFAATAVAGDAAASGTQSFTDGVAVYQGANSGLMAGVNIGGDMVRYQGL